MGVHWKIWFLAGRGYENSIYRGNCLKNELGQLADLRGGGGGGGGEGLGKKILPGHLQAQTWITQ